MIKILIGTEPTFKHIPKEIVQEVLSKLAESIPQDISEGCTSKSFHYKHKTKVGGTINDGETGGYKHKKGLSVEVAINWQSGASVEEGLEFED